MRTQASLLVLFGCALGCATAAPRASKVPEPARPCLEASTRNACATALGEAAESADRARAGQLLMLAAAWAPQSDRAALARAAAWLAPAAWVPPPLAPIIDEHPPPAPVDAKGAVLLLRGAPEAPADAGASVRVDLQVPSGPGPFAGDALASVLAASVGADAAAWQGENGWLVTPAAPLLERIAGFAVAGSADAWSASRRVGQADRALRAGHGARAYVGIEQAIAALPGATPACRTRGALHYLRWTLAGTAYAGAGNEHLQALARDCTEARVTADEHDTQAYLRELSTLQLHRGTETFALPRAWIGADGGVPYGRKIDGLAARLGDRRGALLVALRDEMLAYAARPKGRCDKDFVQRSRRAAEEARERLGALGRDDLAMPGLRTELAGKEGIASEPPDAVLAWANDPRRRWVRTPALTRALGMVSYASPSPENARRLAPLCDAAREAILRELRDDRFDDHTTRNVVRMFALLRGAAVCGQIEGQGAVVDEVFAIAMQGEDGKFGAWTTLGLSVAEIATAALRERVADALVAGVALRDAMFRLRTHLGESDEDVVLDTSLGIVLAGVDRAMDKPSQLPRTLQGAITRLEPIVARSTQPAAPKLVRMAPAVHLAALVLLALVEASEGDPARRDVALARLDSSIDRDVTALLQANDALAHKESVVKLLRSLASSSRALGGAEKPSVASLMAAAGEASTAGADEPRWWGVGLNASRVVAWDLAAHAALQADPKADVSPSMAGSSVALQRLASSALRDFDKKGTGFEVLHLLAPIHHASMLALMLPEGAPDRKERILAAVSAGANDAVTHISTPLQGKTKSEAGFFALLVEALRIAKASGGVQRVFDDAKARHAWAKAIGAEAAAYPPELSLLAQVAAGIASYEAAPEEAKARFGEAAKTAAASNLSDTAYLPRLVEAATMHHAGSTEQALGALDEVLSHAREAHGCGAPHEVDSLLPVRAWSLERLGRHAEADEALRGYLDRMKVFSGEATLRCRLVSYRPTFTFTVDASQRFDRIFFGGEKAEGSLQAGMGIGDPRDYDRIACSAIPLGGDRPDLHLAAHLTRAAYAMRAGDDRAAHASLLESIRVGRRMQHGDDVSVGFGDRISQELGRKGAMLSLPIWVASLARSRGHLAAADDLDALVRGVLVPAHDEPLPAVFSRTPSPPSQLAELGFDDAGPWIRSAWRLEEEGDARAVRTAPRTFGLAVLAVQRDLQRGQTDGALARLRAIRAEPGLQRTTVSRLGPRAASEPTRAKLAPMIETLGRAGMTREVVAVVTESLPGAVSRGDLALAGWLVDEGLKAAPSGTAPLARADLLLAIRTSWPDRASTEAWARDLAEVHAALEGTIPVQEEVGALHHSAVLLGRAHAHEPMVKPLARLLTLMDRALGKDHEQTARVAVLLLAVRATVGQDVSAEAREAARRPPRDKRFASVLQTLASGGKDGVQELIGSIPPL